MKSVQETLHLLLAGLPSPASESVPLDQAAGRVLAAPLTAPFDLPPFTNSSMDGFAVRSQDLAGASAQAPHRLSVVGDVPAGTRPDLQIAAGQAARIMTGAPLPDGADAVVPVERTDFSDRQAGSPLPDQVLILDQVSAGAYLRRRGEDLAAGDAILPAGARLRPQDVSMAAMLGLGSLAVFRRPRVALLATGDELLPPGAPPEPGKIYESNSLMLAALLEEMGARVVRIGIARDSADDVQEKLDAAAAEQVDLIVSSAGVSVGAYDFVRAVVEAHGRLDAWKVNMRPGKPLAFGVYRGVPFVGLPGNPVSSYVGFEVFLRPAMAKMSGWSAWQRSVAAGRLAEAVTSDGRESYLRARAVETGAGTTLRLTGHQGSGNHFSLVQANALAIIPAGVTALPAGAAVDFWKIS